MQQIPVDPKKNASLDGSEDSANSSFDGSFAPWEKPEDTWNGNNDEPQEIPATKSAPGMVVPKTQDAAQFNNPSLNPEQSAQQPQSTDPNFGKNPRMGGFYERYFAFFIDKLIVGILLGIITTPFQIVFGVLDLGQSTFLTVMYVVFIIAVSLGLEWLYVGYFYTKSGQTPGKQLFKLKVVKNDNLNYVTWKEAFLRDIIGKKISGIVFNLGYIWYFFSNKKMAWDDSIAKTYVVKTDTTGNILMDGHPPYQTRKVWGWFLALCLVLPWVAVFMSFYIIVSQFGGLQNLYNLSQDTGSITTSTLLVVGIDGYKKDVGVYPWEAVDGSVRLPSPGQEGQSVVEDNELLTWIKGRENSIFEKGYLPPEAEASLLEFGTDLLMWYEMDTEGGYYLICYQSDGTMQLGRSPTRDFLGNYVGPDSAEATLVCHPDTDALGSSAYPDQGVSEFDMPSMFNRKTSFDEAVVHADARDFHNAVERYYTSYRKYPWQFVFGSRSLPEPGDPGLPVMNGTETLSWISGDDMSLVGSGEIKPAFLQRPSLEYFLVWYDINANVFVVCYSSGSNGSIQPEYNKYAEYVGEGGADSTMVCLPNSRSVVSPSTNSSGDNITSSNPLDTLTQSKTRLAEMRDSQRATDVNTILAAIYTYSTDYGGNFPSAMDEIVPGKEYQLGTCSSGGNQNCPGAQNECVDLGFELGEYLRSVPQDPSVGSSTRTGYTIIYDPYGLIEVSACNSEAKDEINVSR